MNPACMFPDLGRHFLPPASAPMLPCSCCVFRCFSSPTCHGPCCYGRNKVYRTTSVVLWLSREGDRLHVACDAVMLSRWGHLQEPGPLGKMPLVFMLVTSHLFWLQLPIPLCVPHGAIPKCHCLRMVLSTTCPQWSHHAWVADIACTYP